MTDQSPPTGAITDDDLDQRLIQGISRGLFDLRGRVAVVTGAAVGLGRAIAVGLAYHGATIVCTDMPDTPLDRTIALSGAVPDHALALSLDVTDRAQIEQVAAVVMRRFGRVDILVNNAGVTTHSPAEECPMDQWDRIINVNLRGLFQCCQVFGRIMIAQRSGAIINLSSIGGEVALGRGNAAFCASKGGVGNLTRELAIEWAPYGVRVNAIAPCQIRTPGLQHVLEEPLFEPNKLMALWQSNIPLGRIGEMVDLVGPAIFLASEAAALVTGHVLPVDGGYLAR